MQNAVDLALIQELRVPRLDALELDGDFFARCHVGTEIDITEGARADLAAQTVLAAHAEFHGGCWE